MQTVSQTDCEGEHFVESGTIVGVTPRLFHVQLSSGCGVTTSTVVREPATKPAWPWLVMGATLDVEIWHAGGPKPGGSEIWLILRASETGEFLFTNYQLDWQLIEDGGVREELPFGVEVARAVCEEPSSFGLWHERALRFDADQTVELVRDGQFATLRSAGGIQTRVQRTDAGFVFDYTATSFAFHSEFGSLALFSAWPE